MKKNEAKKGKIRAYYQTLDDTGLADLETGESNISVYKKEMC